MTLKKWVLVGLIGCTLFVFGYFVYMGQRVDRNQINSDPTSVAAVRGGTQPAQNSFSPSNVVVDYTRGLKDDLDRAKINAKKYEDAGKAHIDEAGKAIKVDDQGVQALANNSGAQ